MRKGKRKEIGLKDLHGYIVCSPDQKKTIKKEIMDPLGEALKSIQFVDNVKNKTKKKD